jgi:hypothetical protein
MRSSILTLVARLIGDFRIASYNNAAKQKVMNDAGSTSPYSHWLVLGPFQIGTRGGFHLLAIKSISVLIRCRGIMGCRSFGKVWRLSGTVA